MELENLIQFEFPVLSFVIPKGTTYLFWVGGTYSSIRMYKALLGAHKVNTSNGNLLFRNSS